MQMDRRFWQGFWQLADIRSWTASSVPMAVGGALAFSTTGRFELGWFILALLTIYLIETGKNAVNEVVDYKTGVDRFIVPERRTPFSGGKKTIVDGKLTLQEAKVIAIITIGAACLLGLYIALVQEPAVFWVGLAGVFLAIFYVLPPFKFAYRGLGEVVVGITFGPLIVSGVYLMLTHTLNLSVVAVSLPIGFLIANVLWINQYPDYEADQQGNKRNGLIRLGKERGLKVYALLFSGAYAALVLVAVIFRNPFWLVGFFSLPLAIEAVKAARVYYDDVPRLIQANIRTLQVYQLMGVSLLVGSFSSLLI